LHKFIFRSTSWKRLLNATDGIWAFTIIFAKGQKIFRIFERDRRSQ
jgi:hypothetical protein